MYSGFYVLTTKLNTLIFKYQGCKAKTSRFYMYVLPTQYFSEYLYGFYVYSGFYVLTTQAFIFYLLITLHNSDIYILPKLNFGIDTDT